VDEKVKSVTLKKIGYDYRKIEIDRNKVQMTVKS